MRLFLAIELPDDLRERVSGEQARLRATLPGWRWVRPDALHVTLRFLGEVSPSDRALHASTWSRVASAGSAIRIRVSGAGVFPGRGRPRILWFGLLEDPPGDSLDALASSLEEAARTLGFAHETRPFRPHLTVARAARTGRPARPADDPIAELGVFTAGEIALVRSDLGADGARYTVLERYALG